MKIWIVGAEGLLGSTLSELCKERRIAYLGTGRQRADVTNLEMLRKIGREIKPTHIINCAAYTDVDRAESDVTAAYRVNAEGPEHLGVVAQELKCRMVQISTDYVFSGDKHIPYLEDDVCGPVNIYARSKYQGELSLLRVFPRACIIRSSWLFGVKGKNFISSMLSLMKRVEEVKVVADQQGKPTYCKDLAEAVLDLLEFEGVVHFANDGVRSRFEMAQDIYREAKALGIELACKEIIPVSRNAFPTPAERPAYSVLDTAKVEKILGRKPRQWDEVLRGYLGEI